MASKRSGRQKVSVGQVVDVFLSGRQAEQGKDERVCVRVAVDPTCPRELALAVRDALVPERAGGVVDVRPLAEATALAGDAGSERPDALVVLLGEGDARAVATRSARSGVPVALVAEGALDAPALDLPPEAAQLVDVVAASSAEALPDKLAAWLAGATEKDLALAANFPFCRRAVADALVSRAAAENAVVGAVSLIPGSDLPLMCANQAKLALEVAAAFGRELEPTRVLELAGVVSAGFAYRGLARTLVGLLPGLGLPLKAAVGFGGTVATGQALVRRFELEDAHRAQAGEKDVAPAPSAPAAEASAAPALLAARPDVRPAPEDGGEAGYVTIGGGAS